MFQNNITNTKGKTLAPNQQSTRVFLSQLRIEDANELYNYRSKPEVFRYQGWRPTSIEEVQDFITQQQRSLEDAKKGWLQQGIYLQGSHQLIGDCGLHLLDDQCQQVELGISLSPGSQGQGYAFETMQLLFAYFFGNQQTHRITTSVDPRNTPSLHLMERLGMRKEAHHIKSYYFRGEWVDDVIFALLRDEWKAQ